jgi:hypothetical protein
LEASKGQGEAAGGDAEAGIMSKLIRILLAVLALYLAYEFLR